MPCGFIAQAVEKDRDDALVVFGSLPGGLRDLAVEVVEPGPGLFHVRTGQPGHRINLHHQVPPQVRLSSNVTGGV